MFTILCVLILKGEPDPVITPFMALEHDFTEVSIQAKRWCDDRSWIPAVERSWIEFHYEEIEK